MKKLILLAFGSFLAFGQTGCFKQIGTTEVGVKVRKLAPVFGKESISKTPLNTGLELYIPFVEEIYIFNTELQNLVMNASVNMGDRPTKDELRFKTVDGNDISMDITISYRIDPTMVPYIVANVAKNNNDLRNRIIRTIGRSIPRDEFGTIKSEEFYVSTKRTAKQITTKEKLNKILNPLGVIVEGVPIGEYKFNRRYTDLIKRKKEAEEQVNKIISRFKKTEMKNRRLKEQARGKKQKMIATVDGDYRKAILDADSYLTARKTEAGAILFEGKKIAEAVRKERLAMIGSGGSAKVKLAIAKALQGKRIVLVPTNGAGTVKTMDLNELLNKILATTTSKRK